MEQNFKSPHEGQGIPLRAPELPSEPPPMRREHDTELGEASDDDALPPHGVTVLGDDDDREWSPEKDW